MTYRALLSLFFLFLTFSSFSQKVKIKDEIATVDGEDYLQLKRNRGTEVSIFELDSTKEVLFARYMSYTDFSLVTRSNPEGKVRWLELKFLTLNLVCEVPSMSQKGLVKLLHENNIFVDGVLNDDNVQTLIQKYGSTYTNNRPGQVRVIQR